MMASSQLPIGRAFFGLVGPISLILKNARSHDPIAILLLLIPLSAHLSGKLLGCTNNLDRYNLYQIVLISSDISDNKDTLQPTNNNISPIQNKKIAIMAFCCLGRKKIKPICCRVSVLFTIIMIIILSVLLAKFFRDKDQPNPLAMCGDCHCIVGTGLGATSGLGYSCPTQVPKTGADYGPAVIATLKNQTPNNPFTLSCDPYDDEGCALEPPQDDMLDLGNSAVCGLVYQDPVMSGNGEEEETNTFFENTDTEEGGTLSGEIFEAGTYKQNPDGAAAANANANAAAAEVCPNAPTEYLMISYPNVAAAEADGAAITHVGACGACSTTQDLAVYLEIPDLHTASKTCAKRGILNKEDGKQCFLDLGFTDACAAIWIAKGENTAQHCTLPCAAAEIQDYSNNGPAPECALNGCLECDEKYSGKIFEQVAGRTRRRSGILSTIARSCDDILFLDHGYACPDDSSSGEVEEVGETEEVVATAATSIFEEDP